MRLNDIDSRSIGELVQDVQDLYSPVRGTVLYVDPYGAGTNTVASRKDPVDNLYDIHSNSLVTSGQGDRIIVYSGGTTSAHTTSYMDIELPWAYHNTRISGIAAPTRQFGRARVSNKERTTGAITTIAFPTTTTITDSAEGFLTAGFAVGQTILIDTTSNTNDGTATITAVTAGTITCSGSTFTPEDAATAGSTTIISYQANLMTISGDNNLIENMHFANYGTSTNSVGAVKVTGNRNCFIGCHFYGMGHATAAANASGYDVLLDGAEETTFINCTFGSDTIIRAAANGNLLLDGGVWRARFYNCEFYSYSATAGKGAVKSADATAFSGIQLFKDCVFLNWNPNGIAAIDDVFIGTDATSGDCVVIGGGSAGYTGWGAATYIGLPTFAASGAGGIATTE